MESGARGGSRCRSQNCTASKRYTTSRRLQNGSVFSQLARLLEGLRISKPVQLSLRVCMQSEFLTLTRNSDVKATSSRGCRSRAVKSNRLSTLERSNEIRGPPSNNRIQSLTRCAEEALVCANWKFIAAAQMQDLADIEVSKTPIEVRTKTHD